MQSLMTRAGLAVALLSPASESLEERYFQIMYDYEVAAQCGLVSVTVERSFRVALERAERSTGLDAEALRRIRIRAIVASDQEYDNRGLGGHRSWCRNDGTEGVQRLLEQGR